MKSYVRSFALSHCALLPSLLVLGLPLRGQSPELIAAIEVQGAKKITQETVIFKSGLKVGDDLQQVDLSAVTEKLWQAGVYEDIRFLVEEAKGQPGKKKLIIRLQERPIIKEVDYRGGTELGVSHIKDKVKEKKLAVAENAVYDPDAARKVKALIVELCNDKGFRTPVVSIELEPMGPGLARLVFDVKEGGKVRIYKIHFRGNTVIKDAKLASAMQKTREHWMLSWMTSHDLLVDKNMEEDLQNIKKEYWRIGYKDVFVGKPIIDVEDKTTPEQKKKNAQRMKEGKSPKYDLRAALTIPIVEGDKYYEGKLKIEGNEKLYRGERGEKALRYKLAEAKRDNRSFWAKTFDLKPSTEDLPSDTNRPYDLDAYNKGTEKVREAYQNASYAQCHVEKKTEVREENGVKKVDTTLKLNEGEAYTVGRINFEGNTTTKDKVLRRAFRMQEGDPFCMDAFRDAFIGLGQLGFFDVKNSFPDVVPDPTKPVVDITIRGEEAPLNEMMANVSYGQYQGAGVGGSFRTRNLGGNGETLGVSANFTKYQRSYSLNFEEPYVFDKPFSFSAGISEVTTKHVSPRLGGLSYTDRNRSLSVGTGFLLNTILPASQNWWTNWTQYHIGYTLSNIRMEGNSNYFARYSGTMLTSAIKQSLTYSTKNHPFKPNKGFLLGASYEYGGWQFGTDRPYYRFELEMTKVANLAERHIFAANFKFGRVGNLGKQELPIWLYYAPGGENSIRGYRPGSVGSIKLDPYDRPITIGGTKQFYANFEYQFKVAEPFYFVLFYDTGNAWMAQEKMFNQDMVTYKFNGVTPVQYKNPKLVSSAGVELRFFLPISPAPLRLIWARKLNPYPFDPDGKTEFQFSIGTTF